MQDALQLLEHVGIEIVLTGVFVLMTLYVGRHIARARRFRRGIWMAKRRLGVSISAIFPEYGRPRMSGILAGIALLALAAMVGHLFTLVGDEVLDSKLVEDQPLFLYVPKFDDVFEFDSDDREWDSEDKIKRKTLEDALEWSRFDTQTRNILARHVDEDTQEEARERGWDGGRLAPPPCSRESRTDCARAFFQHAQAVIRERGSGETRAMLSRHTSVAEFLSVVFVAIWMLALATVIGPVRRFLMQLVAGPWSKALPGKLVENLVIFAWLWIAQGIALRLWTEQTRFLDRKVIHSYLAITSGEDAAMDAPSVPSVDRAGISSNSVDNIAAPKKKSGSDVPTP